MATWDFGAFAWNIKATGAKVDGVTDDTAALTGANGAITKAIAAGGGEVDFPQGTCVVTSAIAAAMNAASQGISFKGVGRGVSILKQTTSSADCLVLGKTGAEAGDWMRVNGLSLQCPGGGTGKCLRLNNCLHGVFESIDVSNGAYGIYLEGQNESHHIRDITYGGHTVSAFSAGNTNGGTGSVLDNPEMQKATLEHWRIGGGTNPSGPAIDINAGIIGGSQQVSGAFTLDHVVIEGWNNHQIRLTQTSLAWHISNVVNEVTSGLTDATYDGIQVAGSSSNGTIQDCSLASRDDGAVNRFLNAYNIGGGSVLLLRCVVTGLGPSGNDFTFTGNGGGTVVDCGLSSATLFNVSGSAVNQVLVLNLRKSNGTPFTGPISGALKPYSSGLATTGYLYGLYNEEAQPRWFLTRDGGLGLSNNLSELQLGPGGAVATDVAIGRLAGGRIGVAGAFYLSDLATVQFQPSAGTGGLWHAPGVPSNANGNNNDRAHSDNGYTYFRSGGVWAVETVTAVNSQAGPSNPTGTTSTTGVMMGLAGAITPKSTGRILVILSGDIFNNTINDGASVQLRYGTGGAPVNGAALTGTAVGGNPQATAAVANEKAPFSIQAIIMGLAIGTAVWLDAAVAAITGGTGSIENLSLTAIEI